MTIAWSQPTPITGRIDFPDIFESSGLGIWITGNVTPVWNKLGFFQLQVQIDDEFFQLKPERLEFGKSLIIVPFPAYKLSFIPIPNLLQLYPTLSIQLAQIDRNIMGINYGQVDNVTGAIVSTTVAALITSVQALPVDLLRHEGTIYNQTNRIIYVSWGTAAATTASLAVPVGSNIDIPEDYTGAVQVIGCRRAVTTR